MAITSKYDSKCKDCGIAYLAGEDIDTNGNKSPNKAGELKDHWCKMGKNCAAMQKGQFSSKSDKPRDVKITTIEDPTPEQFLVLGRKMLDPLEIGDADAYTGGIIKETQAKIATELIKRSAIEKAMNDLGLQHPSRIAFIKDVLR